MERRGNFAEVLLWGGAERACGLPAAVLWSLSSAKSALLGIPFPLAFACFNTQTFSRISSCFLCRAPRKDLSCLIESWYILQTFLRNVTSLHPTAC